MPTIDPFTKEGAQKISTLANQPLAPQADPIDLSALSTPPKVTVPELPNAPLPDVSLTSISGLLGDTGRQTELRGERDTLVQDISATGEKLATKSAKKAELETGAGLPDLNKQLTELNSQIRSVQAESFAATQTAENRPMALELIRGEQAAIERQRAVRVYGLAAAAEAIQGNIALANDQVQRALDAEFGGLEQEIENKKFLLSVNKDNFNEEEKRRAEALEIELDKQKEALEQKKAEKQSVFDIMLEAAKNGADNLTLNRISSAATLQDAIAAASTTLNTPDTQIVNLGDGRAVLVDLKTGKTIASYGSATPGSGGGTGGGGANEFGQSITPTAPPKAPTEGENTSYVFFERMKNAVGNIDRLEADIAKLGTVGQLQLKYAPDILLSSVLQQYRQAQREFTEARLRKDSGAAIPPEEFENDKQTYFPQPGNKVDVLTQKATSRQVALDAIRSASGNKYWLVYGQSPNEANSTQPANADKAALRAKYGYDE